MVESVGLSTNYFAYSVCTKAQFLLGYSYYTITEVVVEFKVMGYPTALN